MTTTALASTRRPRRRLRLPTRVLLSTGTLTVAAATVLAAALAITAGPAAAASGGGRVDTDEIVTQVKRHLGSASQYAKIAATRDDALHHIGEIEALLAQWRTGLLTPVASDVDAEGGTGGDTYGSGGGGGDGGPVAEGEEGVDYSMGGGVALDINVTSLPDSCSRRSEEGSTLKVHYIGKLAATGKIFDSSFHTGSLPVKVVVGGDEHLAGWNEGLLGMCVGERRTLTIPPELGFGSRGTSLVPPNAVLQYHMELVEMSGGSGTVSSGGSGSGKGKRGAKKGGKKRRRKKKGRSEL